MAASDSLENNAACVHFIAILRMQGGREPNIGKDIIYQKRNGELLTNRGVMAERKQARNVYFDTYAAAYLAHYSLPYASTSADWVMLDQITNKGPLAPRMTLEVFQRGCDNYFKSELGVHTLKHLCSMFVPFWKSPLDRFGKPKEVRQNGTRTGMRSIGELDGLPWQFRFAAKVNAAYDAHPVPERAAALTALFDQMEDEQLNEQEATRRLQEIENGGMDCS